MNEPNSKKFLDHFSEIETYLHQLQNRKDFTPFKELVKEAAKSNAVIRRFENELYSIGDLRNAIVHRRANKNETIAEPHDSIVMLIEKITNEIKNPKKVIPEYTREVITFDCKDSLLDVLKVIKENSFSQFPIYKRI